MDNNFIAMTFHLLAVLFLILELCNSGMIEFDLIFNVKVETTIFIFENVFWEQFGVVFNCPRDMMFLWQQDSVFPFIENLTFFYFFVQYV